MPSLTTLLHMRIFLLLTVLSSVGAGLLFTDHLHKVAASASGGILAGVLASLILTQISKSNSNLWREINKNAVEAQQILEQTKASRWWNYGAPSFPPISSPTQSFAEMLEHPMISILLLAITAMVWMSPTFTYSVSLYEVPSPYLVKALGTHALALLFIGGAVMGVALRLQRKSRNAP